MRYELVQSPSLLSLGGLCGCLHHGGGGRWGRHIPTPGTSTPAILTSSSGQPNLPILINLYRVRVLIQAPWPTTIISVRSGLSLSRLHQGNTFGCLHHGDGGRWGRHVPTPLVSLEKVLKKRVQLQTYGSECYKRHDFPRAPRILYSPYFTFS